MTAAQRFVMAFRFVVAFVFSLVLMSLLISFLIPSQPREIQVLYPPTAGEVFARQWVEPVLMLFIAVWLGSLEARMYRCSLQSKQATRPIKKAA